MQGVAFALRPDRNFHLGGRSFYFFDFDDNIVHLDSRVILFHKNAELPNILLSSKEFVLVQDEIGKKGPYRDYLIDFNPEGGSFVNFRDQKFPLIKKLMGRKQIFAEDIKTAILLDRENRWQGPSWRCFLHAVVNQRPLALITARGHHVLTLKEGIRTMVQLGAIPREPDYLALYPVNHQIVRTELGDPNLELSVPELKRRALRQSVQKALKDYGYNPYHRFGMSDDDPENLNWIYKEMKCLKQEFPFLSFFVIETSRGRFIKHELSANLADDAQVLKAPFENLTFPAGDIG